MKNDGVEEQLRQKLAEAERTISDLRAQLSEAAGYGKKCERGITALYNKYAILEHEFNLLKEKYELLRRNRFKASSEVVATENPSQPDIAGLFDDPETELLAGLVDAVPQAGDNAEDLKESQVRSYVRKVSRNSVIELPADTPVTVVEKKTDPPKCGRCGAVMERTGTLSYLSLVRTTSYSIVETRVPQFRCPSCEPDEGDGDRITVTPPTGNMLEGCVCDPLLLANIISNKMALGLPLYRQEQMFLPGGGGLTRSTMSAWIMRVGRVLARNLLPAMERRLSRYPMLNVDETTLKVLDLYDEDGKLKGRSARSNAFMIVRAASDGGGGTRMVLFTFRDNRRNGTLTDILSSYSGVVQSDGLAGYVAAQKTNGFVHLGCMVHAKRKSNEANGNRKSGPAKELLDLYAEFFHAEGEVTDEFRSGKYTPEEFVRIRRERLTPRLDALRSFLLAMTSPVPGTKLETARDYPLERWDSLVRFLDYPFATSSNQKAICARTENAQELTGNANHDAQSAFAV
jgi:transposase